MNVASLVGTIIGGGDAEPPLAVLKKIQTLCTLRQWGCKNFWHLPSRPGASARAHYEPPGEAFTT